MKIVEFVGGLGNQMFQYAFLLAIKAKSPNDDVFGYIGRFNEQTDNLGFQLGDIFGICLPCIEESHVRPIIGNANGIAQRIIRKFSPGWNGVFCERYFHFDPNVFDLCKRDQMYFRGLWQDSAYFDQDISAHVKRDFRFKDELNNQNSEYLKMIEANESVSIHIRRGDYISNPKYNRILGGICDEGYYSRAISEIEESVQSPQYFIFSDDEAWVRENFGCRLGSNATYIIGNSGKNSHIDMLLMTKCKHNIIANSSFSWWGAWLNENPRKKVIGPKQWFKNDAWLENNRIIPSEWTAI